MQFRIADTFTDSLARLTAQEQKAVKTTAFDLQVDPANPGMRFHRLNNCKDPNFWSVRVNRDIRMIVHRTQSNLLLCYVDHHDDAYGWAERRKIETHPKTGAAQIVELRERVEEVTVYKTIETSEPPVRKPLLYADLTDDDLLAYGVPEAWLADIRAATEDTLFDLAPHLPQEAVEALLDIAVGEMPRPISSESVPVDQMDMALPEADALEPAPQAFDHPDAQRRFRLMSNVEELERALDYPWEKWTIFLHPAQRRYVERSYNGPARISGSAGTGKTIVALHRAAHLARSRPNARVLLTTFSPALANALRTKLERLAGNEPALRTRIQLRPLRQLGLELFEEQSRPPDMAPDDLIEDLLEQAGERSGAGFSKRFLVNEWHDVVDAWRIETWEAYRSVPRLGRKTRIGGKQREALWRIFNHVHTELKERGLMTWPQVFGILSERLGAGTQSSFDHAVVDEAQDVSVAELRFLAALVGNRPDGLFFAGDLGQRIFQPPFSWRSLGVDIRGRSHTLRINYRTSHQIRARADRLLPGAIADVDGVEETRTGTISVFNGPTPLVQTVEDAEQETAAVGKWLAERLREGAGPSELGVFVRDTEQLSRARAALAAAGVNAFELSASMESPGAGIAVGTMHLAKGLEFRAVAVMACDDEVVPLQSRIEAVADESDLQEVYDTERHLLYVACTRAREHLLVTGVEPASEFLDDMESV